MKGGDAPVNLNTLRQLMLDNGIIQNDSGLASSLEITPFGDFMPGLTAKTPLDRTEGSCTYCTSGCNVGCVSGCKWGCAYGCFAFVL
jgi:hypothetical protein